MASEVSGLRLILIIQSGYQCSSRRVDIILTSFNKYIIIIIFIEWIFFPSQQPRIVHTFEMVAQRWQVPGSSVCTHHGRSWGYGGEQQ